MFPGGESLRDEFLRVFVAQFVEGEAATVGDGEGFGEHLLEIAFRQALKGAQIPFAVAVRLGAEFRDRGAVADGGDDILQGLPGRDVHVYVVAGDDGEPEAGRERQGMGGSVEVRGLKKDLEGDPQLREEGLQALALLDQVADGCRPGNPQGQTLAHAGIGASVGQQVVEPQGVFALGAAAPSPGDEFRKLSVCLPRGGEQHQVHVGS